jgi:hypothetical protein
MLLVIFGAGASYDSDPSRPATAVLDDGRPPLANQLFDNREAFAKCLSRFPKCAPIVPWLRGCANIEKELERLQSEATDYPERLQQLASVRGYLQLLLGECSEDWHVASRGITSYVTLLDLIRRWGHTETLLVTFNYDTLLEKAVTFTTGRVYGAIDDYVTESPFPVIKVHGSVNWGRVVKGQDANDGGWSTVHRMIAIASSAELTAEYVVSDERPIARGPEMKALVPAIAIPMQTKREFACPANHLDILRQRLPEVRDLLVVGWRGQDQHFVELLREGGLNRVRAQVVSDNTSEAKTVADTLESAGIGGHYQPIGGGFSSYITNRTGDEFLQRQSIHGQRS